MHVSNEILNLIYIVLNELIGHHIEALSAKCPTEITDKLTVVIFSGKSMDGKKKYKHFTLQLSH